MQHPLHGLSRADRQRFETRGLVKLEGLVPPSACEAMADAIWRDLARRDGVQRHDPASWTVERPWGFQAVRASGAFKAMATPALRAVADDLMDGDWREPRAWGQPLVCFPSAGDWMLPAKVWHLDLPGGAAAFSTRIGRLFVIVAPLAARGGGTLVATGSHRLVTRMAGDVRGRQSSAAARLRLIARHPWFRDLMSEETVQTDRIARFMDEETIVDGVPCRVEEMIGEPGDVFLMHPASLHAPSPNAQREPRLVLSESLYPAA